MVTRFYLGGSNDDGGKRFPVADVVNVLAGLGIKGATLLPGHGFWEDAIEENWVIEVWDTGEHGPDAVARALKNWFHQYAVAYQREGEVITV